LEVVEQVLDMVDLDYLDQVVVAITELEEM
jgi:hypothetical protein